MSDTLYCFRAGFRLTQTDMAHFLASVRQSMLASRRAQPTPQDFQHALAAHQLSLDSLLLHLDPPVPAARTQPPLRAAAQTFTDSRATDAAIARLLQDGAAPAAGPAAHVPRCFPGLPSRHTYKAEAVYARRELDPKRIRERATEEGRLGEAALRRLVSGERANARQQQQQQQQQQPAPLSPTAVRAPGHRQVSLRQRTQDMWLETMEALSKAYPRRGLGSRSVTPNPDAPETTRPSFSAGNIPQPVNADRQYWRKPPRQAADQGGTKDAGAGN